MHVSTAMSMTVAKPVHNFQYFHNLVIPEICLIIREMERKEWRPIPPRASTILSRGSLKFGYVFMSRNDASRNELTPNPNPTLSYPNLSI